MDNEEFESLKKDAELKKLNKEIVKLDAESKELSWRKFSAWAPAISSIIIGFITLYFTISSGFLDGKSALVKAEALVMQVRKDSLSRTIDSLKSIYRRDSMNLLTRINNQNKKLDSLSQKFIQDKIKFDKERAKNGYVISQKEKEIVGLKNEKIRLISEKIKVENCLIKAKEFLKYCIRYEDYEPALNNQEFLIRGYKPPYKTRFSLSLEEVANLNISSMTYDQFLKEVAGYKAVGQLGTGVNDYINSSDGKQSVIVRSNFGNFQATARNGISEIRSEFECYKSFSNTQKLQLLKQMIIRTY
jgi:hypothetical protein